MVVLTNGCSFSRGPGSWPYALQTIYNFDLINLAQSGAGNTYIFESTIAEIASRNYDLVIIMWTDPNRIDMRVNIEFDSPYTSLSQSLKNDWPEKKIFPVNDQDYVQKDWAFGCGYLNKDKVVKELFDSYYRYSNFDQMVDSFLTKVIGLQGILAQQNINYVFTFYADYIDEVKKINPALCSLINWDNCCIDSNIDIIMKENQWYDIDGAHPDMQAHQAWAQKLKKHIDKKQYAK